MRGAVIGTIEYNLEEVQVGSLMICNNCGWFVCLFFYQNEVFLREDCGAVQKTL